MSETGNLFNIQNVDTQLDRIIKRLGEIDHLLKNNSEMVRAKTHLDQSTAIFEVERKSLTNAENDVEDIDLKLKQNENKLYGGSVKDPKELQDLQIEHEAFLRRHEVLEEIQLNAMIALEEAENAMDLANKNLKQVEARMIEESAGLRGEALQLDEEKNNLNMEREALLISVSKENLKFYEKLRLKKNGLAVVAVSDDACSGCGSMIRPAQKQEARTSIKPSTCSACGRILFIE